MGTGKYEVIDDYGHDIEILCECTGTGKGEKMSKGGKNFDEKLNASGYIIIPRKGVKREVKR